MSHAPTQGSEIRIRAARADDMADIARVAGRDTSPLPAQPLLVAEVGSDVRAAISIADGSVVADPFHRTAELVEMLRIRARGATGATAGNVVSFKRPRRERLAFRSAA